MKPQIIQSNAVFKKAKLISFVYFMKKRYFRNKAFILDIRNEFDNIKDL